MFTFFLCAHVPFHLMLTKLVMSHPLIWYAKNYYKIGELLVYKHVDKCRQLTNCSFYVPVTHFS
jgi:hypothetical protein